MMPVATTLLSFAVLVLLSVWLRRPLWQSAAVAFLVATALWISSSVAVSDLILPLSRAMLVSCEIALILLGAITFLELMRRSGRTEQISAALVSVSKGDLAVSALLLAWFFCSFLEGAAGFGAPAAIIAPLAVTLGFSPLLAATLPLIGDSVAVPFGAVGTPIRIGLFGLWTESLPVITAALNMVVGIVAPLMIVRLVNGMWSWAGCKLALFAAFMFTAPAFALSFFGPEFPTLGGSIVGMALFLILMPRSAKEKSAVSRPLRLLASAAAPYGWLCLALLIGKLALSNFQILIPVRDEVMRIAAFQPGILFMLVGAVFALRAKDLGHRGFVLALRVGMQRVPAVWIAIFFMAAMAQYAVAFLDVSSWDGSRLQFPIAVTRFVLAVFAPVVGALGAFVTGSATVSCLLTGGILFTLANLFAVPTSLILALMLLGAGAGNMIALQNLAAVQATVGLVGKERELLEKLWFPCLLAVLATGLLGGIYVLVAGAAGTYLGGP